MKGFKTAITWHLTKAQALKLKSWAARTAAGVKGIRRATGNDMATFWRYLHREGHRLLDRFDADPVREHQLQVHRLGGHIASMENSTILKIANEATGLVAFSPGEMDRQALWPPTEEV